MEPYDGEDARGCFNYDTSFTFFSRISSIPVGITRYESHN